MLPVFRSQHQAELLMWLMLHPDQEFGVSDLAVRLSVPLSTLHREVVRLDDRWAAHQVERCVTRSAGLVMCRPACRT